LASDASRRRTTSKHDSRSTMIRNNRVVLRTLDRESTLGHVSLFISRQLETTTISISIKSTPTFCTGTENQFLPCDAIGAMHRADYAVARCLSIRCLSVRPSVTRQYSVETAKYIFKLFFTMASGSHTILDFPHQTVWQYSDRDFLTGASNAREV